MENLKKFIRTKVRKLLTEEREIFTTLYHGTDLKSALNIKKTGIDISKGYGGYFGWGFYTTPDIELAKSNYADFSGDDEGGAILELELDPKANILDLRDAEDFEVWKKYSKMINNKNLYKELISVGIDGLWDDSFDGVVIYNPNVLTLKNIHQ